MTTRSLSTIYRLVLSLALVVSASPLYAQYAGGPTDVCSNTPATYSASSDSGCNFSGWSWNGVLEIVSGEVTDESITVIWSSNGQMWGSFSCGTFEVTDVTLHELPAVAITASATEIQENQPVTLTASGAQSYSWSGPTIVQPETRTQITVYPPAGTATFTLTGRDQYYCSKTVSANISVTTPPVSAGPDRSYCKDLHTIDLGSWGPSLAAGTWSGQAITNGVINLNLLAPGNYSYTYTRTADGLADDMVLTVLASYGGDIVITRNSTCEAAEGTLSVENNIGVVQHWERSYNSGISWSVVPGSQQAATITFSESGEADFRVAVKNGTCAQVYSAAVTVQPLKPVGGNLSMVSEHIACGWNYGSLSLQDFSGDKFTWESNTGAGWAPIAGVTGNSYNYDVTTQTSFRVKIEWTTQTCSAQYSTVFTAYTDSQGGTATTGTTAFCETASGIVNLAGHVGNVTFWQHSTDNITWQALPGSEGSVAYAFTSTLPVNYYRAAISFNACAAAYSNAVRVDVSGSQTAGKVILLDETSSGAPDQLVFNAIFKLVDYSGNIRHWRAQRDGATVTDPNTTETWTIDITESTAVSALVQAEHCDPFYSGRAVFVVNRPYVGVQKVIDLAVAEYDGHSYTVGEGLSLQEGFGFQANSGQDFFVVLDENYSIPPPAQNYVLEETILDEGLKTEEDVLFSNARQRSSQYTYVDGLGRPVQQVQRRASPQGNDVVKPVTYDAMGRPDKDFLAYVTNTADGAYREDAIAEQLAFYISPSPDIAGSDYPFAVTVYEESSRKRVKEQGAPGADWQPVTGHTVRFDERMNDASEIKRWVIDGNGKPVSHDFYYQGDLRINVVTDEHGSAVKEYLDKSDLLIFKAVQNGEHWLQTAYIYDRFDQLRYVIQPEGMAQLSGNPGDTFLDTWAFQYRYDVQHRLIEKYEPGAGWEYLVYDGADRVVLTQDGNQRSQNQWAFTKYDGLNRPVIKGIYTFHDAADPGRVIGRQEIGTMIDNNHLVEQYNGNASFYGYTNLAFPTGGMEVHTVSYYDDYRVLGDIFNNQLSYDAAALEGLDAEPFDRVKGLVTAQQVRVLGTSTFLKRVTWYDKRYRNIQMVSEDIEGIIQRVSNRFDFAGKVMARSVKHTRGATIIVTEDFTYDHAGRLLTQHYKVGDGVRVLQKEQKYNELGQLAEKNLHGKTSGFLQSVDYRYHIRGWLTHINNAALIDDGGVTNNEANDFFGFELRYNNASGTGSQAQFNGNISQAAWKAAGTHQQSYVYSYDGASRLTQADYFDAEDVTLAARYTEKVLEYDANGNIRYLQRRGRLDEPTLENMTPYGLMDDLNYQYTGNRLMAVTDEVTETTDHEGGFKDHNKTGDDYAYDVNGNMALDKNKDIQSITYNHLNLPQVVTKNSGETVVYTYDAAGRKVSQQVTALGANKKTDYAGQFIYENGVLQFILNDEGRVVMNGGEAEYQYFLKDHLGNVRVTCTASEEVEESKATFETANAATEQVQFLYYEEAVTVNSPIFDNTNQGPSYYSTRLNGSLPEQYGVAKSLSVMPGDTVRAEVYVKYADPAEQDSWEDVLENLLTTIANNTAPPGTFIDGGAPGSTGGQPFLLEGFLDKREETGTAPKAYLNWLVFDRDYKPLDGGYIPITEAAKEDGKQVLPHELLQKEIVIGQAGFVYFYLSNDNVVLGGLPVDVFFDDFNVTHVKSAIVQTDDYYPFGLTFNAYQRENSISNKWKFQGQEHVDDLGLNWDSFKWRNYQPDIGRFFNVDPLAEKYKHNGVYAFAENKVTTFRELEGLEGVHYMEGKNHIVEKNVMVLLTPQKAIPEGADAKTVKKIQKENVRIGKQNAAKMASVSKELNTYFNGSEGKGTKNSRNQNVVFRFNMIPADDINDTDKRETPEADRNTFYMAMGNSNGLFGTSRTDAGKTRLIAPAAVLTTEGARGGVFGDTHTGVIIRMNSNAPEGGIAHEVLHTLGPSDNGYTRGGLLNSPPHSISSSEVDEVLRLSYEQD